MNKQLINNLTIRSFRGTRDLTLESLGKINLLVGDNNSGKTSLLEAIYTCCNPLEPLAWLNTARLRETKSAGSKLESIKWLFPQSGQSGELYQGETLVSANTSFGFLESSGRYEEVEVIGQVENNLDEGNDFIGIEGDEVKKGAKLSLKASFSGEEPMTNKLMIWSDESIIITKPKDNFIPVEIVASFYHRAERLQVELLTNAIINGNKKDIIELISTVDPAISNIFILCPETGKSSIYVSHEKLGIVPLSSLGEGLRSLLFIALTAIKLKKGILLVDDIGLFIHPDSLFSFLSWLVRWCRKMEAQLFLATHSLDVVDKMLNVSEGTNDLVLYRLPKIGAQSEIIRIDQPKLTRIRHNLYLDVR